MSDEDRDTFGQWRIYIIRTLESLSSDVEALKKLTSNRTEYLQRFERVEEDLGELKKSVKMLDKIATKMMVYAGLAGIVGSAITLGIIEWVLGKMTGS